MIITHLFIYTCFIFNIACYNYLIVYVIYVSTVQIYDNHVYKFPWTTTFCSISSKLFVFVKLIKYISYLQSTSNYIHLSGTIDMCSRSDI